MRTQLRFSLTVLLWSVCLSSVGLAQRGGDRGDRGGDRGDRGGFGGGFGGGPPGGFGGGPPGGFGGGPPGGFGGGPPGGFGGGPPGGFGGGPPGGGRGGFDPSSFIDRLDRNGNGMLDPDEMEGPAQFMISRMQRDDPSIRTDRPIPMSKFRESFDKMRSGRGGDDRDRDRGDDDDARRAADEKVDEAMIAAPLVPGFGLPAEEEVMLEPVLGFGPSAELMTVEVTPKDQSDAEEVLRRYDRNNDGSVSGDEISSRWAGNPLDFDRNGDKKLTLNELAIRAARRRVVENSPQVRSIREGDRERERQERERREKAAKPAEPVDLYKGRKSYLAKAPKLPEGLPGWFATRDQNMDFQVAMSEYSDSWSNEIVEEFMKFDTNGDGVITAEECVKAVEAGVSATNAVASSEASSSRPSSAVPTAAVPPSTSGMPAATSTPSKLPVVADEKVRAMAEKIVKRNDTNGDGALTANEWSKMLFDIKPADTDQDGRITIPEYAAWTAARDKR
jgi:Ca2+-binding EF-hand superfamily protein